MAEVAGALTMAYAMAAATVGTKGGLPLAPAGS